MNFGIWCGVLAAAVVCTAEKWQWPDHEQASSLRIDTKVRFTDQQNDNNNEQYGRLRDEEVPFQEAAQTDGFYNRPPGAGRFPVRVETHPRTDSQQIYTTHNLGKSYNDGTLDSLQYCKCVSSPECGLNRDSARACGAGKFLCCYKRPNKVIPQSSQNTEYFNEIDDERPSLLPGNEKPARAFPPPPNRADIDFVHHTGANPHVLVGPGGPTGLIGPGGPTSLTGPGGPTSLIGPGGPTGLIGPGDSNHNGPRDVGPSETAQRGILTGPDGPTGIIGPRGYGQRPVLVGPRGPTGIIGPRMRGFFNRYYGQPSGPGVLTGPGGPSGMIGPSRQLLVGPGGPTGRIGPQSYFG